MLRILWTSKSALSAGQQKLDSIANNITNATTPGYKKENVDFKDLVNEELNKRGYPVTKEGEKLATLQTGTGVKNGAVLKDFSQGELIPTDINMDLAIDGSGFYALKLADGTKVYTRDGAFSIDGNGEVVNSAGYKLEVNYTNGPVKFSSENFKVDQDGNITNNAGNVLGTISLYNAIGSGGMVTLGNNIYVPQSDTTVYKETGSFIRQGFSESSNVDLAQEMSEMIVTQRAFQLSSQGLTTADQMWQMANNLRS